MVSQIRPIENSGSSDCYVDRLVDLIDGHMPLDDDERAIIRKYAIEVFGEPLLLEECLKSRENKKASE